MPKNPERGERLTKRAVEALQPEDRRYRMSDLGQPGLKLNVEPRSVKWPDGRKWWSVRYVTTEAKNSELHLGDWPAMLIDAARAEAGRVRGEVKAKSDPADEKRQQRALGDEKRAARRKARADTFGALADAYLGASERGEFGGRDGRPKAASTIEKERHYLGRTKPRPEPRRTSPKAKHRTISPRSGEAFDATRPIPKALEGRPVAEITRAEIVGLLEKVRRTSGPAAANSSLEVLRRVFSYGVHKGFILANPTKGEHPIEAFPRLSRDVLATNDQLRALWETLETVKASNDRHDREAWASATALQFTLLTLQRRGEVASIRREHVDFAKRLWTIPAANKKERRRSIVPLAPWAAELIQEAFQRSDSPWAFVGADPKDHVTPHAITRFMARLRAADEGKHPRLGDLTPHDLRRTARSRLTEDLSVDHITAERILGHVVGSRQSRAYDHGLYIGQKRAALEAWERELRGIVLDEARDSRKVVTFVRADAAEA